MFGPGFSSDSYGNAPAAKHVVRGQDRLVVDEHLGEGVEAVEDEIDMLVLQGRIGDLEGGAILPVGQADPLQP